MEYVPGRSTKRNSFPSKENLPVATSTVFPGQFPVCCFNPVRALNTVLFPVLGLPRSATLTVPSLVLGF